MPKCYENAGTSTQFPFSVIVFNQIKTCNTVRTLSKLAQREREREREKINSSSKVIKFHEKAE